MIVNVNLGGLVQEAGKYYSAVQDAHHKKEQERLQRMPVDNAHFVKAIADAVYCITTNNEPPIFKCCKDVMPNQFSIDFSEAGTQFKTHQKIMTDALKQGFQRVLILEPGVQLTRLEPLCLLSKMPLFGVAILGGELDLHETFIQTSNPLFQYGTARNASAVLVDHSVMHQMVAVDPSLLKLSTNQFYRSCHNVICMVPSAFENTQACTMDQIYTKLTNTYRSYVSLSSQSMLAVCLVIYICLLLFLVAFC